MNATVTVNATIHDGLWLSCPASVCVCVCVVREGFPEEVTLVLGTKGKCGEGHSRQRQWHMK